MVEIPGLPDPSEPPKRVKLPGIDGAEDEKKKEKKGAGIAFSLAGLGGMLMLGGPRAFIAGMLALGVGGAGLVSYTVWKKDRGTGSESVQGRAGFKSRGAGRNRLGHGDSRAASESRASSIGFVAGVEGGMKYRAGGKGAAAGEGAAGAGAGGAGSAGSYAAEGAQGGPGARGAPSRKRLKSMDGFQQNPFSRSGGMQRKGVSGLDNPNMSGLVDFQQQQRQAMARHLQAARSKLASKHLDNTVGASKAMGQLKFAGKRSRQAAERKTLDAQAGYSEQAFSQDKRIARSIADRQGDTPPGTGSAGPAGMIGDSGSSYSTELGRQVSYGAQGMGPGGCPKGMRPVESGGCEPANVGGENSTNYQNLVAQAWSLISKARKATLRMDLWTSTKLAGEAEQIGDLVRDVYGQDMQGYIIRYWADRSNELNHWHKARKRADERRAEQMDPKLDGDVHEASQDSRNAGYR